MAGSVVGLAKQCMRLSMEVLLDGRWQQSFQAKLVAVDPQKRGKQRKLEAKRQRNAEALTGAELTLTRSNLVHLTVRDLLNEISAFSVPTPERIAHAEMADPLAGKPTYGKVLLSYSPPCVVGTQLPCFVASDCESVLDVAFGACVTCVGILFAG